MDEKCNDTCLMLKLVIERNKQRKELNMLLVLSWHTPKMCTQKTVCLRLNAQIHTKCLP